MYVRKTSYYSSSSQPPHIRRINILLHTHFTTHISRDTYIHNSIYKHCCGDIYRYIHIILTEQLNPMDLFDDQDLYDPNRVLVKFSIFSGNDC